MTVSGTSSPAVKTACPLALVVVVVPAVPLTSILEWPDPWDSVTDFPLPTGFLLVSFSVTVTVAVLTPSATAVAGLATTVELVAEVCAIVGADPSPGLSPSPTRRQP